MNTAVINIKVNPVLKTQAQEIAKELGFSLSSLLNACLKQIVRSRAVSFTAPELPTDYMLKSLQKSKKNIKAGKVVSFKHNDEALDYLDKLIKNDKQANRN